MDTALLSYVNNCCKFGCFILSSNKESNFYVDIKALMFQPKPLSLMGMELFDLITRKFGVPDCIGGREMGSLPLSSAICLVALQNELDISHFVVRKELRDHGTKSQIEGYVKNKIVLVDDVLTTGNSLSKVAEVLRDAHFEIEGAVVVVDREEAQELLFPVYSLFKKSDLRKLNK